MIELAPNSAYGLQLRSPVMTAAGCFGYGVEFTRLVEFGSLGAIVTTSTSALRRRAVPAPRLIETSAGVLAVGPWPNPGLDYVLERHAPQWATWSTPVILSVVAQTPAEFADIAGALEGVEGIAGLELNVSAQAERAAAIVRAVRATTLLPLLVKLPALDQGLAELGRAVADAGADAITACAGPLAMGVDTQGTPVEGMLCGPALLPLTLRRIAALVAAVPIPVIACGGIASVSDARAVLSLGARAVQLGAVLLADPNAAARIAHELSDFMAQ